MPDAITTDMQVGITGLAMMVAVAMQGDGNSGCARSRAAARRQARRPIHRGSD
jgi:hypothetical protein